MEKENSSDLVIIGAGPAGLSAAIFALRSGLKTVCLEMAVPGGYPVLVEKIENYPGFSSISGMELMKRFFEQAKALGLKIIQDEALSIEDKGTTKIVKTKKRELVAKAVIVASGSRPKELEVKGARELKGNGLHYCAICDGPLYAKKRVVVFGNNNAALEEAIFLSKIALKAIIVSADSELNASQALKNAALKIKNIEFLPNNEIVELIGEKRLEKIVLKNSKTGKKADFAADALFVYIGRKPSTSFVDVKKAQNGLIIVDDCRRTSSQGIFAAGDCIEKCLRQITTSVADGAVAAIKANEYIQSQQH